MRSGRGYSVVEVLLAVTILGLALVPLIQLFVNTGQQSQQTAAYGLALVLAEKTAEELRLADWENPHQPEQILTDTTLSTEKDIVDGRSPYYAVVEDAKEPYGTIRVGEDPPITGALPALYRNLRTFRLASRSVKQSSPVTGSVLKMNLDFRWTDFKKAGQSLTLPVYLAHPGVPDDVPPILSDPAKADQMIVSLIYPSYQGDLRQLTAAARAEYQLVHDLGAILLLARTMDTEATNLATERRRFTGAASGASTEAGARAQLDLARFEETITETYLQLVVYLAEPLKRLAAGVDASRLGQPPPPLDQCAAAINQVLTFSGEYELGVYRTLGAYVKAYNEPLGSHLPPRVRLRAFLKILEVSKLLVGTTAPADIRYLQTLLDSFAKFQEGHNPNLARFARAELEDAASLATLTARYPAPRRFSAYKTFTQAASKLREY